MSAKSVSLATTLALAALAACADPVHDNDVSALGPEQGSTGPNHRRGQPCVICHGGSGPASSQFAIGGTVYAVRGQDAPAVGVDVQLTDAANTVKHVTSNEAGNFFIRGSDWSPVAPIHVQLTCTNPKDNTQQIQNTMGSHIGRDGSCADCHFEPRGPDSAGHVYLVVDPADFFGVCQ